MSFYSLINGIFQENSHVVFCPNKQRSFEPFICLDFAFKAGEEGPRFDSTSSLLSLQKL